MNHDLLSSAIDRPKKMLTIANESANLPMLWWYQFQYFLNLDVLLGRARNAVSCKYLMH